MRIREIVTETEGISLYGEYRNRKQNAKYPKANTGFDTLVQNKI